MHGGRILWIIILLAALFFGPPIILKRGFESSEMPSLRAIISQEKLIDALGSDLSPTPLTPGPAPVPPADLDKR